jgi:hypothetical protein
MKVKVNFLILDNDTYQLLYTNKFTIDETKNFYPYFNMDKIRMFVIDCIPDYLKDIKYRISLRKEDSFNNLINSENNLDINVYFDRDKHIIRDMKIKKILTN